MEQTERVGIAVIGADEVRSLLSWSDAIEAIKRAVGDPERSGPPRIGVPVSGGELLVMPAADGSAVGVKLAGVAPANPAGGLPRIQGVYALFDAATLTPQALIDGTALTNLRTPAQSALVVRDVAVPEARTLMVFGSGPQAWGHVQAIRTVRPIETVIVVGRDEDRTTAFAERVLAEGIEARRGDPAEVGGADVVVCATTAREPVLDGSLVAEHACVIAIGSHEPAARELDAAVFRRAAQVVVEDPETALREAGDVIQAIDEGGLTADRLTPIGERRAVEGITIFKGVGMAWQDLAVARAVHDAWLASAD